MDLSAEGHPRWPEKKKPPERQRTTQPSRSTKLANGGLPP